MPNQLTLVSFTGADDATPWSALSTLSSLYPFVEWGILYHPEKEGQVRAPSKAWREGFLAHCRNAERIDSNLSIKTALHLCGEQVFRDVLAGMVAEEFRAYDRIQVNINARKQLFSEDEVHRVYSRLLRETGAHIIVQYHNDSSGVIESWMESRPWGVTMTDILMDASRGLGKTPEGWSWPMHYNDRELGFAGGIGPDNVAEVLLQLDRRTCNYGIDMESGVRTENLFDLRKVQSVLEQAKPFLKTTA